MPSFENIFPPGDPVDEGVGRALKLLLSALYQRQQRCPLRFVVNRDLQVIKDRRQDVNALDLSDKAFPGIYLIGETEGQGCFDLGVIHVVMKEVAVFSQSFSVDGMKDDKGSAGKLQ